MQVDWLRTKSEEIVDLTTKINLVQKTFLTTEAVGFYRIKSRNQPHRRIVSGIPVSEENWNTKPH